MERMKGMFINLLADANAEWALVKLAAEREDWQQVQERLAAMENRTRTLADHVFAMRKAALSKGLD